MVSGDKKKGGAIFFCSPEFSARQKVKSLTFPKYDKIIFFFIILRMNYYSLSITSQWPPFGEPILFKRLFSFNFLMLPFIFRSEMPTFLDSSCVVIFGFSFILFNIFFWFLVTFLVTLSVTFSPTLFPTFLAFSLFHSRYYLIKSSLYIIFSLLNNSSFHTVWRPLSHSELLLNLLNYPLKYF